MSLVVNVSILTPLRREVCDEVEWSRTGSSCVAKVSGSNESRRRIPRSSLADVGVGSTGSYPRLRCGARPEQAERALRYAANQLP